MNRHIKNRQLKNHNAMNSDTMNGDIMNGDIVSRLIRLFLLLLCLAGSAIAHADVRVFNIRSTDIDGVMHTLQDNLGDRARVNRIQDKLVVVGDAKAIADAAALLQRIDRLPLNLRLTLTEHPPTEAEDPHSGMLVYTTDRDSQVLDTIEGALVTLDYSKFHQDVSGAVTTLGGLRSSGAGATPGATASVHPAAPAGAGWLFSIDDKPTAVRQLEMRVQLLDTHHIEVVLSYTRYHDQTRKVYGRIVPGVLGEWLSLLPQQAAADGGSSSDSAKSDTEKTYTTGAKPGSQLYLKVEKVLVRTQPGNL